MSSSSRVSRRRFLATGAAAFAGAAARAHSDDSVELLRIGLLGPGAHGSELLRRIRALGPKHDAEVVAVHRDSLNAIRSANIDGVIIATPDHLHADVSIAAIEAGLHVYCASPMARTESEAAAVRDAVRASDCIYQVGAESVFEPSWQAARTLVHSGVIGDVRWCSGSTHENAGCEDGWKTNPLCTHGPAAHHLHELWAACAYVTGARNAVAISSMGGGYQTEDALPDALSLSADFERGVHFNLDCHPARDSAPHAVIRGSDGSLIIKRNCILAMPESLGGADIREVWRTDDSPVPTALDGWLTCVRTGDACASDAELGYEASTGIARAMDMFRANAVA